MISREQISAKDSPTPCSNPLPCPPALPCCSYYFQAEVQGQAVTWLVPHATSQVRMLHAVLVWCQQLVWVGGSCLLAITCFALAR